MVSSPSNCVVLITGISSNSKADHATLVSANKDAIRDRLNFDTYFECRNATDIDSALSAGAPRLRGCRLLVAYLGDVVLRDTNIFLRLDEDDTYDLSSIVRLLSDHSPEAVCMLINPFISAVLGTKSVCLDLLGELLGAMLDSLHCPGGHLVLWPISTTVRSVLLDDHSTDQQPETTVSEVIIIALSVLVTGLAATQAAAAEAETIFDKRNIPCRIGISHSSVSCKVFSCLLRQCSRSRFLTVAEEEEDLGIHDEASSVSRGVAPHAPSHTSSYPTSARTTVHLQNANTPDVALLTKSYAVRTVPQEKSSFPEASPAQSTVSSSNGFKGRKGVKFCHFCRCEVFGESNWPLHCASDKHRRKELMASSQYSEVSNDSTATAILMKPDNFFTCEVCNVVISGRPNVEQHLAGAQHRKNLMRSGTTLSGDPLRDSSTEEQAPDDHLPGQPQPFIPYSLELASWGDQSPFFFSQ